jgi:hypothetical protein
MFLRKEGSRRVSDVSTRTKKKHEAEEFLKAYVPGKKAENIPTLSGLKDVLDDKLGGVLSKKSIASYKGELGGLARSIGDKSLDELEQRDADKWSQQAKARLAATTYNTGLRSLRAIFNRCKKWYPELATLFSSFRVDSTVETHICGTGGRVKLNRWWFCPVPIELTKGDGQPQTVHFNYVGNGYNYEAEEVVGCLRSGKTESEILPLDFSLRLIRLLDRIRKQMGLVYDADLVD